MDALWPLVERIEALQKQTLQLRTLPGLARSDLEAVEDRMEQIAALLESSGRHGRPPDTATLEHLVTASEELIRSLRP